MAPRTQAILFFGLTAIFAGYFLVWLPGPGVGLQLIGVEIGEWIKFLGVGVSRNLFYLPPIVLGMLLALLTIQWPNDRWQTWTARLLAVAFSLLVFPAIAAITTEPRSEWLIRLILIGMVFVIVIFSALLGRYPGVWQWTWLMMAIIGIMGAFLPTWQYLVVRPLVVDILQESIGIGLGVWINAMGCLIVAAIAIRQFLALRVKSIKQNSHSERAAAIK